MPQTVQSYSQLSEVIKKLRSKRAVIQKLPVEKQLDVYGVAFDRFVKPHLTASLPDEKSANIAKDRWIQGVVDPDNKLGGPPKSRNLPTDFALPQHDLSNVTQGSAALVGALAGAEGGLKNILHFVNKVKTTPVLDAPGQWLEGQSAKFEAQDYALAHGVAPKQAQIGAAVGHLVPSAGLYEGAAGLIPDVAKGTPMAWKILSRLSKAGVGGAAGSIPYGDADVKTMTTAGAVNTAIDVLFGGIGTVGARGASKIISKVKAGGTPVQAQAATAVEDLFATVAKEKFPGRDLSSLKPTEFDSVFTEAKARRAASESQAKEAAKAVKAAQAPKKLTPEEKIASREQEKVAKAAARKAESAKHQAFHKRLVEYRKATGTVPAPDSEHFNQLKNGKTAAEILGTPEARGVVAASHVADVHQAQVLIDGAPSAIDAVKVVKDWSRAGTVLSKDEALSLFDTSRIGEGKVSKNKPKPPPMFTVDTSKLKAATTPEEFASAKKSAMADIEAQAREKAKTETNKEKIMSEYVKARETVRSHPVPENISKKALDSKRKAADFAEGQRSLAKAATDAMADPDEGIETQIDRSKLLFEEFDKVGTINGRNFIINKWRKQADGNYKVLNEMLEQALENIKKAKGQ